MKKIKSFMIDHDKHDRGFYLSNEAYGNYTYDLRFKLPNKGDYLTNSVIHTIEHLFATVSRNSAIEDRVVYFGPMGCRTGFYFILRDIEYEEALAYTIECMKGCLILSYIPGTTPKECGNYQEHDLEGAKQEIIKYLKILS